MSTATDAAWIALCDELVELSAAEHADLLARRQALCLQAAHMSAEQQRAAHGQVDARLLAYIAELEAPR